MHKNLNIIECLLNSHKKNVFDNIKSETDHDIQNEAEINKMSSLLKIREVIITPQKNTDPGILIEICEYCQDFSLLDSINFCCILIDNNHTTRETLIIYSLALLLLIEKKLPKIIIKNKNDTAAIFEPFNEWQFGRAYIHSQFIHKKLLNDRTTYETLTDILNHRPRSDNDTLLKFLIFYMQHFPESKVLKYHYLNNLFLTEENLTPYFHQPNTDKFLKFNLSEIEIQTLSLVKNLIQNKNRSDHLSKEELEQLACLYTEFLKLGDITVLQLAHNITINERAKDLLSQMCIYLGTIKEAKYCINVNHEYGEAVSETSNFLLTYCTKTEEFESLIEAFKKPAISPFHEEYNHLLNYVHYKYSICGPSPNDFMSAYRIALREFKILDIRHIDQSEAKTQIDNNLIMEAVWDILFANWKVEKNYKIILNFKSIFIYIEYEYWTGSLCNDRVSFIFEMVKHHYESGDIKSLIPSLELWDLEMHIPRNKDFDYLDLLDDEITLIRSSIKRDNYEKKIIWFKLCNSVRDNDAKSTKILLEKYLNLCQPNAPEFSTPTLVGNLKNNMIMLFGNITRQQVELFKSLIYEYYSE